MLTNYFSFNAFRLRKIKKILKKINNLKNKMEALTDEQLQNKTIEFKERIAKGESLDSLLVEAYAVVREADKRILGKFPYDVQVMGGIVLHQGNIAEMKTGEGKTLTATLPLYLNALTGKGVMLVTTNGYLAKRDGEEMGQVFKFLGLTVGIGDSEDEEEISAKKEKDNLEKKKDIYNSDIIYTTNGAIGFDYLLDNLAASKEQKFMREFNYVIIDEVDSVLLDAAQTPLVISGAPRVQSNMYKITNDFVQALEENVDYKMTDEKDTVWLTTRGSKEAEKFFYKNNLYIDANVELIRHINLALAANLINENGKDYIVHDEKVVLLDQKNGRLMDGTKLQGGQHQAIEQKERVKLTDDLKAVASITYQNLFKMFKKISGMTGTGKVAEKEFIETYNMAVVVIPTNKPVQRKDLPDSIYKNLPEKFYASLNYVKKVHETGQPILLFTGSVDHSEIYSELLLREGIAHNVLNARNAAKEAEMIKEAGQLGAVTVATAMAGRGTDIHLGKGVPELGGLAVIGTERMESKRTDLQVRGRSGRQGDPGISKFFVSLEDDVVIKHGPKWVKDYYKKQLNNINIDNPEELTKRKFKKVVDRSQESYDNTAVSSRKMSVEMDESIKIQRNIIYNERNELLKGEKSVESFIEESILSVIKNFLENEELTEDNVLRFILDNVSYRFSDFDSTIDFSDANSVGEFLYSVFQKELQSKAEQVNSTDFANFQRIAVLKSIDEAWVDQVDNLQQLRGVVSGRQIAGRNPIYAYYQEALLSYEKMKFDIRLRITRNIGLSSLIEEKSGEIDILFP